MGIMTVNDITNNEQLAHARPVVAVVAHEVSAAPAITLANFPLFANVSPAVKMLIEKSAVIRNAEPEEELMSRDSRTTDVFFVLSGQVRIVNYSTGGREVAYATASAGSFFGELSAIDGGARSASVVAIEECKLAILPQSTFRDVLLSDARVAFAVMEKLTRIIRSCDQRILDLATLSAYQRVYLELLKLKRPDPVRNGSWIIYPLPTQAQIAALASTTRETVARVLSQLQSDGIVERKSKTLYIRQVTKLEKLCERAGDGPAEPERAAANN